MGKAFSLSPKHCKRAPGRTPSNGVPRRISTDGTMQRSLRVSPLGYCIANSVTRIFKVIATRINGRKNTEAGPVDVYSRGLNPTLQGPSRGRTPSHQAAPRSCMCPNQSLGVFLCHAAKPQPVVRLPSDHVAFFAFCRMASLMLRQRKKGPPIARLPILRPASSGSHARLARASVPSSGAPLADAPGQDAVRRPEGMSPCR